MPGPYQITHFRAIALEVNRIKRDKRFTVVIGNPPYSLISANMGDAQRASVERYKFIAGERIKERGALQLEKILNDDYVKFIAKSQDYLTASQRGVLALITNHAYLDNPTMRGLRHSLLTSFTRGFFCDLGGSAKKIGDETDENVFDIQQGVAICVFQKSGGETESTMRHARLLGNREDKYKSLARSSVAQTPWSIVSPTAPFFLFIPTDYDLRFEYEHSIPLAEVFPLKSIGLFTSKDSLVLDATPEAVEQKVRFFQQSNLSNDALCEQVGITAKAAWNVTKSRERLRGIRNVKAHIVRFLHRPFDYKYLFYERSLVWSMAWPVNRNLLPGNNVALTVSRQLATPPWNHVFCSNTIVELCYITNKTKEGNHVFPLWVLPADEQHQPSLVRHHERQPNIATAFLKKMCAAVGSPEAGRFGLPDGLTPEDIFQYAYAVFHSPEYRRRYAEFLKIDFPRLPLTSSLGLLRALARLGGELVALHLMESPKLERFITSYVGPNHPEVGRVGFTVDAASSRVSQAQRQDAAATLGTVWINAPACRKGAKQQPGTVGFKGVPEAVWNFHVGGYQVCHKWLKDRKGRTLSEDDIAHYQKIVVALNETIRIMAEIDEVIDRHGGWPGAFASGPTAGSDREAETVADSSSKARGTTVSPKPVETSSPSARTTSQPPKVPSSATGASVTPAERKAILAALAKAGRPLVMWKVAEASGIGQARLEEVLPVLVSEGLVKRIEARDAVRYSRP